MAIDPASIDALWPSLLVFAEVGFALLLAIPAARMGVKEHLDKLYSKQKKIKSSHFIIMDFYLNVSSQLLVYSILYLVSIVSVLLAAITDLQTFVYNLGITIPLKTISFYIILVITVMVVVTGLRAIIDSIWKTIHVSEIPVADLADL